MCLGAAGSSWDFILPMHSIALGIDLAARSFVAALWFDQARQLTACFPNDKRGFGQLGRWLKQHKLGTLRVGLEHTNSYGLALAHWLHAEGHQVHLLNPERVKRYAQARGQQNKTDPADARTIAAFVALHGLPAWVPPPARHTCSSISF